MELTYQRTGPPGSNNCHVTQMTLEPQKVEKRELGHFILDLPEWYHDLLISMVSPRLTGIFKQLCIDEKLTIILLHILFYKQLNFLVSRGLFLKGFFISFGNFLQWHRSALYNNFLPLDSYNTIFSFIIGIAPVGFYFHIFWVLVSTHLEHP